MMFVCTSPPTVTTNAATGVGGTSVTLSGNLASLGTAGSVTVSFVWGTSPGSYPNETAGAAKTVIGTFYFDLGGLDPSTTYYYLAKAVGDGTSYGVEMSFTTATPPSVVTNDATSVTANSARLRGELASLGTTSSVMVSFVYGTSPGSYPNETAATAVTTASTFFFDLSGLTPGIAYYYKAKVVGDDGTPVYGAEKTFTPGGGTPSLTGVAAEKGSPGNELTVMISGSNLSGIISVDFGPGITVKEIWLVSDSEITARIVIDSKAEFGARDVSVTTTGGTDTKTGGFTVARPPSVWHSWWMYLVAIVGGLLVLTMIVYFAAWVVRRLVR
jgi:hypothetical protein